jgi:hypothetical protein
LNVVHEDCPVKQLSFDGNSIIKKGNKIIAAIPRYKTEHEEVLFTKPMYEPRKFYFDRDWNEDEMAIELQLLGKKDSPESMLDNILRKDRSIQYYLFMKK